MFTRSHAFAALIVCTSVAFAQEAATPVLDTPEPQGGTVSGPSTIPSSDSSTGATLGPKLESAGSNQGEGFLLPGGMGYAPLDFTPGQGRFDRKPLSFGTTIQQGYDDNVDSTSGSKLQAPVKGSLLTSLSQNVDVLLAQSRVGLSLGANAGGQYYWNRTGNQLTPNGGLNLIFAYRLTPRAQLSAIVNGLYTNQPTLSVANGLARSNGQGYLTVNSKLDLLYQWTPRFSTDTSYSANGLYQSSSSAQTNNNLNQTIGESFRYAFSHLVTGVLEGRYSQISYSNLSASTIQGDSSTYYALVGADVMLSRRLSESLRVGTTTRSYQQSGQASTTSPYVESTLNYSVSKTSALSLDVRYGYEDGGTSNVAASSKSVRTGLSYSQALSSSVRGSFGLNYSHVDSPSILSPSQDQIGVNLGLQYALSQSTTLFGSINRTQISSAEPLREYKKDVFYLGASFQY